MQLGKRIEDIRVFRKMKQKDLARGAGISTTYLSDIENDRTLPSVRTLTKIAQVLEIDDYNILLQGFYVNSEQRQPK
ncbi:MAG TPA: helix-turn-helix transcriptional regulator [Clostridia bacterium]|nr:helix-turn-helix transcriptional regulator [Clostridia bacterium]